ncbi:MAG: N-acetylmuramoyl-L-alanine amidase [Candidatus Bipolaricaulia bacterium]
MLPKSTKTAVFSLIILILLTTSATAPGWQIRSSPVRITIDAGHGGYDPGAIVSGTVEKNINLKIALKVKELGLNHPSLKFVLTRSSDTSVSLLDRLRYAERQGSSGYLSIQANSFRDPGVHGIETILDRTRRRGEPSWDMARSIQESLVGSTGAKDRGIHHQRLYTRYTKIPSAMVEVGFLTSPLDRGRLLSEKYRESVARGIIQGLLIYFSK